MKTENNNEKGKKLTLKERLKDKKEKAKIELTIYGIFFIGVIIFSRAMTSIPSQAENSNNNNIETNFITDIKDNYEYDIKISTNDKVYEYYGKVLGNNSTINLKEEDKTISYYLMNNKYYILENENYILVDEEEVYPYINYRYLNINNIKEYINIATKEDNVYKIKLSDFVLNCNSEEYIIITIDEGDKSLTIDYTELFKLKEESKERMIVNIAYTNIDKIMSLEE